MKFEVSERIRTSEPKERVLGEIEAQFRKISEKISRSGEVITAKSIEASFGSINRKDVSVISLRDKEDGFLCVADVNYRPSAAFWIIILISIWTYVFWLIPIVFYLIQKKSVRAAIEDALRGVKNEFEVAARERTPKSLRSALDDLEKLANLRKNEVLTEEEFISKKAELLNAGGPG